MANKSITDFKAGFTGKVILPDDSDYTKLKTVFYGGVEKNPQAIILPNTAEEVSNAVKFAKESGLELAIRSGGHSPAGFSTSDGIVIDLRNMKKFEINKEEKTAWIQPGLTAGEFTKEVDKYDLALGFGDTGSVGIGGITAAGGIGYLVRNFGMAIDNLLEAEVVTANGEILTANNDTNSDLFWAVRGGGSNFGILTNLKFKLHDIGEIVGGMMILPATIEVISGFMEESEKAPNELSSILNIMPAFPMPGVPENLHGKLVAMALMIYSGPKENAEMVFKPFKELAIPIVDNIKPMRYPEIFFPEGEEYHPKAVSETMFLDTISIDDAINILERLESIQAPMKVTQLRPLGGYFRSIPEDATAFAHRKGKILANIAAFYETDAEKIKRQDWVNDFVQSLDQGYNGGYSGFLTNEDAQGAQRAYPAKTYEKLLEIKKKYDPHNLFRLNQNIE